MQKTFLNLQDEVLQWMADEGDAGLMRNLVKQSLDKSHRAILTSEQLDFMLSPVFSLAVTANQKYYSLPENFLSLLYAKNASTQEFLEEIPAKSIMEANEGLADMNMTDRFMLTGVQCVQQQPTTAGTVTMTQASAGASGDTFTIQGLDSNDQFVEETVAFTNPYTAGTSTTSFKHILGLTRSTTPLGKSCVVTRGSQTLVTLNANVGNKQYQVLEFCQTPTQAFTLEYRYFMKPVDLTLDGQVPQLPEMYRDILVYDALLMLPGFTKADQTELMMWQKARDSILQKMKQNHQQSRSLGARARRIRMIERS